MRKSLILVLLYSGIVTAQQKDYTIRPVTITQVKLDDRFWSPKIETNRTVTIPASFARCENTGRVKNFEMAAAKSGKFCTVFPFDDTDIYKTIEGASYSMAVHPDEKLNHYVDSMITIVGKAQEPDGYLYTARTIDPLNPHKWAGSERWVKENELSHELYNSGHMFEAAAAH
ncbi:MAG: glycoside hydrolase family 127 protein, partial [Sphingobacteriaceae bacterium]